MNAHCNREVKSLEEGEWTCRITGFGYLLMEPTQGSATIIYPGMKTNGFSYQIGQGCPPCLPLYWMLCRVGTGLFPREVTSPWSLKPCSPLITPERDIIRERREDRFFIEDFLHPHS